MVPPKSEKKSIVSSVVNSQIIRGHSVLHAFRLSWAIRLLTQFDTRVEVCDWCFDRLGQKIVCFDRLEPGLVCFDWLDPSCLYFDYVRPRKNISTKFDRGKTFWPRSIEEKRFDRRVFSTEKNLDREKTVRLCSTEEKCFDRVQLRSFFRPRWISTEEKRFDPGVFSAEKKIFRLRFFAADCRKHIQF